MAPRASSSSFSLRHLLPRDAATARGWARAGILVAAAGSLVASVALAACTPVEAKKKKASRDGGDYSAYEDDGTGRDGLPDPTDPDYVNENNVAFGRARERDGQVTDGGVRTSSEGGGASTGGTSGGLCEDTLRAGDLAIVEMMIKASDGAGDHGEWFEVQNTRNCTLNLRGLRIGSPRGDAGRPDMLAVDDDMYLPPNGVVVVATSADPEKNGGLPGAILAFPGEPTDVLKNDGDSIQLTLDDGTIIDRVTYPRFTNLEAGRSISFPLDCAWDERPTWDRWSFSFYAFGGSLKGTPNGDNTDVACY